MTFLVPKTRGLGPVFFVLICVNLLFLLSCSAKRTDLREMVPAESLVYLESNDLAATLQPIVDAKPFREAAKSRPDFSALKGVQVAVAVTGFETTEEKVTDENSVARIMPRFVAVADTHAWNFQAVGFAEQKLGGFVSDIYGGELKIEKAEKHGGKYFTWTSANDNRKAFGLVVGSLIYFGNDESAIEKCLAVKRGEADSMVKTGKIQPASADVLASGYVSTDGVAQIASVAGIQLAAQSSDESETRSAIAGIVPQLIRGTVTEASWTMKRSENGIEDSVVFSVPAETGRVLSETIVAPDEAADSQAVKYIPQTALSVTRYSLKDPRLACKGMLQTAQKQADPITAQLIAEVARLAVADFGIEDPELFLASVKPDIYIYRIDAEGDESVLICRVGDDLANLKRSLSKEFNFADSSQDAPDAEIRQSKESDLEFVRQGEFVLIGSASRVSKYHEQNQLGLAQMLLRGAPVATAGRDATTAAQLIDIIAHENPKARPVANYTTETRFTRTAIERRTVSDFGMVGSIISFLDED
jgi:hypothetical protein